MGGAPHARPPRMLPGRAAEVAALEHTREQSRTGQGQAVAILGEAGIGKSALLREWLGSSGGVLVRFVPSTGAAWGPLAGLATGLVDRGADPASALLGPYAAALGLLTRGDETQPGPTPAAHPLEVAEVLLRLWSTLPVPQRPVLGVEDVHWCDEESLAVVERWVDRAPAMGVMLVMTVREEGPRWPTLRHLVDGRLVRGIRLEPLSRDEVKEMVGQRLGVPPTDVPQPLAELVAATGGLPLLVEEVVDDLLRRGELTRGTDGWELAPGPPRVPATVGKHARERLDTVTDRQRLVVRRAALMGDPVDNDVLGRSLGLAPDDLHDDLLAAADAGLLAWDAGSGRVRFRHDLLRESVVQGLLDVQREDHARAVLAALGADDATDLPGLSSARLALACQVARFLPDHELQSRLGLRRSRELLAHGSLVAAAEAASDAADLGVARVRAAALGVRAEALALAGQVDRAREAAAEFEAVGSSAGLEDPAMTHRVREAVVRATAHAGSWDQADELIGTLRADDEPPTTTSLAALIALELGRNDAARAEAERAAGGADPAAACEAMEVLGRLARGHDLAAAEHWFRLAAETARDAGLGFWHAHAAHELATIAQLRSLAVAPLYDAREIAITAGATGLVGAVDFHIAAIHGVRFEPEPALVAARRLLAEAGSVGAVAQEAWAWILVGQAHAVAGHRVQAEQAGREARRLCPEDPEIVGMAIGCCGGLTALLQDDAENGVAQWQEGILHLRMLPGAGPLPPWYLWPILATVLDLEGDGGDRARSETSTADVRATPGADALWHLATAVAAGRAGDIDRARAEDARAEELYREVSPFAGWWHLAHRWVALEAAAAGWGDPAVWMLAAETYFTAHELSRLAATCRSLARKAGAPQRRRRGGSDVPAHLDRLGVTSREIDVMRLVAEGLTNKEIGERLFLSPRTVKGYVEQLLAKTSSTNRTQLAVHLDHDAD